MYKDDVDGIGFGKAVIMWFLADTCIANGRYTFRSQSLSDLLQFLHRYDNNPSHNGLQVRLRGSSHWAVVPISQLRYLAMHSFSDIHIIRPTVPILLVNDNQAVGKKSTEDRRGTQCVPISG